MSVSYHMICLLVWSPASRLVARQQFAMALHKMLISQKDEFTVDLDKAYLVEESKDLICTQYDVKLTFGGKVHLDQKQWIEIQGMRANCSQAKDYICALCNPAEMAELIYPVELEEVIKDSELRCRVEKQSSVALCYEESGKVSIQGNDPVSVTTAYSMLEDIISQHWDKTKENTSRKPKQASRKLDAKLKRLNSVNKLDVSDETPSLSNTIKHVVLDVLKTNKDTSCSDSLEDYGIRIHHGRQIKQIDSKGTSKGKSEVINDPGKYLKEYALEKGYSEDKVESIFAAYGRDVKFDIFFRALNDMIKVPQDKRTSVVKSAENISDTQDIGDTSSSSAGLTVSDNMAVECSEEKEIILNVSTLKKRNMKRQQLLEADNVCSAPKGISLLDQVQTEGEIDSTFASAGSSQKPVTIDLTGDDSQDETYDSSNHEGTRSLGKIVDNFYLTEQTIVQKANAATNAATLSRLRHIVIDGSNVAMAHGNHKVFSCRGIEIVVNYFLRRGHKQVTAFVPQWRKCATSVDHISDQHLLDELQRAGHLVFTPSRKIQGKQIVCYDDRYVVKLAQEVDGVIVSNDNYRDLWYERPDWRHVIENRLLMYSFVGDLFMPPDDPLGRNGPSLDEFLRKPITNTETKQNRHSTSQILPGQPSHPPSLHPGQMFRTAPLGIPSLMNIPQFPHQLQGPPSWNNVIVGRGKLPAAPQSADQGAQRCLEMADFGHSNSTNNTTVYKSRSAARQSQHHQERAGEWRQIMPKRRQTFLCKGKPREEAITRQLYRSMKEVFTDHDDAIQHVLEDNPMEEDLNTLSEYLLNYLSSN